MRMLFSKRRHIVCTLHVCIRICAEFDIWLMQSLMVINEWRSGISKGTRYHLRFYCAAHLDRNFKIVIQIWLEMIDSIRIYFHAAGNVRSLSKRQPNRSNSQFSATPWNFVIFYVWHMSRTTIRLQLNSPVTAERARSCTMHISNGTNIAGKRKTHKWQKNVIKSVSAITYIGTRSAKWIYAWVVESCEYIPLVFYYTFFHLSCVRFVPFGIHIYNARFTKYHILYE